MNQQRDPYPSRVTSCQGCQQRKKGCTKEPGGCSGCRSRSIPCIYPSATFAAIGVSLENHQTSADTYQGLSHCSTDNSFSRQESCSDSSHAASLNLLAAKFPLQQIMNVMEAPMSIIDDYHREGTVQDPDLMPTWEDFECVLRYFSTNPRAAGIMSVIDTAGFLLTFFQQPPPLRLVITATAAHHLGYAKSEESALWFFNRARKAMILAADRPSVSTATACYWIYVYSKMLAKEGLGLPFLKISANMVKVLRLDIDPDDSPWLYRLQLTEIEKEERRRVYWGVKNSLYGKK
ncbi:hypothetical protein HDU79_009232 [Rhizoclosmatium sp. JEL0117]|nr:hypothetical protein HDU79_009232 [Rhizoclosmatium sp. JEL0117]